MGTIDTQTHHRYPSVIEAEGAGMGGDAEAINELAKALDTGDYVTAVAGTTDGAALRVQSLEGTLKVLTFQEKHAVLWAAINKLPAWSTVEEYDELNAYGSNGGSFVPQGVAPQEDDSTYTRRASYVKYMGTLRKVTHPATLVRMVPGDIVARENENGTLKIIRDVENALFWGDSTRVYGSGEGLEFNGLNRLIDSSNIIDCAGAAISEGTFEDAATIVADNYGMPDTCFLSNRTATAFTKSMLPKGRAIYPSPGGAGGITAGQVINQVNTQHGQINLKPSVFLNQGRSPMVKAPETASSTLAPTTPASVTAASMTGATGVWRAAQYGTFQFRVSACNRFGESAACALGGSTTVTVSDIAKYIPLTITNAASVVTAPEWFNIYATAVDGSVAYLVGMVTCTSGQNGNNGTTSYHYTGQIMGGTSIAFIGEFSPQVLTFKQLAPLMKMDLAVTEPSIRWMILLYGTLQVYMPKRWVRIINALPIVDPSTTGD